jgi:hypothetical protein
MVDTTGFQPVSCLQRNNSGNVVPITTPIEHVELHHPFVPLSPTYETNGAIAYGYIFAPAHSFILVCKVLHLVV